jgi:L-fucose mutarotase
MSRADRIEGDRVLSGLSPLLTGTLLHYLDDMGHSDSVVVADAHFPAARLGKRVVELPGASATDVVAAIRSVLPLDEDAPLVLMAASDPDRLPIHDELLNAARLETAAANFVDRFAFYELATAAFVIVRAGEQRIYANALLRKGIVR